MDAEKRTRLALRKNLVIGTLQTVFGWILVAIMLLALWGFFIEPITPVTPSDITLFAAMLIIGVILIFFGMKRKQLEKRFKLYVGLISSQHTTSIVRLAQNTGESVNTVIKRLNKMIDKNFFTNVHIDLNKNEIVVSSGVWQPQFDPTKQPIGQSAQNARGEAPRVISVKCSGCGAVNAKFEGIPSACEYCGTAL